MNETPTDTATPVQAAETTPPAETPPADDDAALESQAVEIPTGEKLVPLGAVTSLREKFKATKAEAATLREQAARATALEQQLREAEPYIEAARALLSAQASPGPAAPAGPTGPTSEETAELEALAKDLDFYKPDGSLDLDRAKRQWVREHTIATRAAQQAVAPYATHTAGLAADAMFQRALATKGPNGEAPDPAVLRQVWQQLPPSVTANERGAAEAWTVALGRSVLLKQRPTGTPEVPAPMFTEPAGGRATATVTLNDGDRRVAKDLGMSEADYAKMAAAMPWRK